MTSHLPPFLDRLLHAPAKAISHEAVMRSLEAEGAASMRYCVMILLSCGIAILGLLLSSPAVVIGAMLISPLMSPIVLFGFSLSVFDVTLMLKGLKAIALGTGLAVGFSALIVWLSPLAAATPEILARTQPNFFDLLVAVFSAVAGAYAVALQKGETIVGVAIATSLMPPLAVVGYGLAVGNLAILAGAAGLFMTNLLAIGLTASLVARFFGFGAGRAAKAGFWHVTGIVAVFAILSIPLGLSLHRIAQEAVIAAKARSTIAAYFSSAQGRLYGVDIRQTRHGAVQIDALVLSRQIVPQAENELRDRLQKALNRPVHLLLSQAPVQVRETLDRKTVEDMLTDYSARRMPPPSDVADHAARASGVPRLDVSADPTLRRVLIRAPAPTAERLAFLRGSQTVLAADYPDWQFAYDIAGVPALPFGENRSDLDADGERQLGDTLWALTQNGAKTVRVTGFEASGSPPAVARRRAQARAETVALALRARGFAVETATRYPAPDQRRIETEKGRAALRIATVEILTKAP